MNDEYLWQKTGTDPEIEKLEDVLKVFRYRGTALPTAEPEKAALIERTPRRRISFAFAFASCVAVAILAVAWFQVSREGSYSGNDPEIVFVAGPENPVFNPPAATQPKSVESPPAQPVRFDRRSTKPMTASIVRRPKTKLQKQQDVVAALTPEERYAYRQLMLALSITGSKLKIVQDAIDGTENTDSNDKR